jgi:hypothetical protein
LSGEAVCWEEQAVSREGVLVSPEGGIIIESCTRENNLARHINIRVKQSTSSESSKICKFLARTRGMQVFLKEKNI